MAQIVKLVDDLDEVSDAGMTLEFGLDGDEFAIDLNDEHYEEYRAILELLASKGRKVIRDTPKVKRTLSTGKKTGVAGKTQEMREWLRGQGHDVKDRGRVPQHLVDLWETRPRGPVKVIGEDDMREVAASFKAEKPVEAVKEAPEGKDTDEDAKAEQKVIQKVKNTPRKASTRGKQGNIVKATDFPELREVLSIAGDDK